MSSFSSLRWSVERRSRVCERVWLVCVCIISAFAIAGGVDAAASRVIDVVARAARLALPAGVRVEVRVERIAAFEVGDAEVV